MVDLQSFGSLLPAPFSVKWRAPSNIAFVKYWGKRGRQLPANPSLSMTLKDCYTETAVAFAPADQLAVTLYLDGEKKESFAAKIGQYLHGLSAELPWLQNLSLEIKTHNTFPHGTGIASSASGMCSFALCLTDYLYNLQGRDRDQDFWSTASQLARLASGSACRSVYGGFSSWGESELEGSSDLFAVPFEVHPLMQSLQNTVLVVSAEPKQVSSSQGHGRMSQHPFAEARFKQAQDHHSRMLGALRTGDLETMGEILENEALSLHAMMLTSPASYTLLLPGSLAAIQLVRDFRQETKLPVYFTLDAGPNLHLIYPEGHRNKIMTFIQRELSPLALNLIEDQVGEGPVLC
jgi:diphosphomevalonate decarboxylase